MKRQGSKWLVLFVLAGFYVIIYSCEKDMPVPDPDDDDNDTRYQPTPYPLEVPDQFPEMEVPEDNPLTIEGVALGRRLFYDPILSSDSSTACASCHRQPDAFSDGGNAFSENVAGQLTDRTTPVIINPAWMNKIFWDGRATTLEAQVKDALKNEQHVKWEEIVPKLEQHPDYAKRFAQAFPEVPISETTTARAIAQFQRTLISGNSKYDKFLRNEVSLSGAESRGYQIFFSETGDCFHCHGTNLLTDNVFHNNGLDSAADYTDFDDPGLGGTTSDPDDYGKFKTPTLRNVAFSAPYMHDGRFETLEEVIDFYSEGLQRSPTIDPLMKNVDDGGVQLDAQQKSDLLAFLKTFSDPAFREKEVFSNPFE